MTRNTVFYGLIATAFLCATAAAALAANSGPNNTPSSSQPGTTPPRPGKVTTLPPPPPPGGPDKLTTRTHPLRPGVRTAPKPYDEFAAKPNVQKYPPLFEPCNNSDCNIESYLTDCQAAHGGASTEPGGAIVCNQGPQHQPKP
jgi:hypothetical protein